MAFKTPIQQETSEPVKIDKVDDKTVSISKVEAPFTDYESQNGQPFLVDHYELPDTWGEVDGGFTTEVSTIDEYLNYLIDRGEISNTKKAVENELKKIEKLTNMKDEDRKSVKLGNIAAYTKFLMESENIKFNARKYR